MPSSSRALGSVLAATLALSTLTLAPLAAASTAAPSPVASTSAEPTASATPSQTSTPDGSPTPTTSGSATATSSPDSGAPSRSAPSASATSSAAAPSLAAAAELPSAQDLFISEIHPDNGNPGGGVPDNFEFFEVTNTTDAAINLAAHGIGIGYSTSGAPTDANQATVKFAVSDGVRDNAVAPGPLDVTVPAHSSTVFWLEYGTAGTTLDTYTRTEADFRAFFEGMPADTPIVRVEGQAGIANGGKRGLSLVDASDPAALSVVSWSYLPERAPVTPGISTHFRIPTEPAADSTATDKYAATVLSAQAPSPGTTTAAQLEPAPVTTPTASPTTSPTAEPTTSPTSEPTTGPTTAPGTAPELMITEVNVNSANMPNEAGVSTDAWEFVEVHNTTDAAIDLTAAGVAVVYLSGSTPKTLTYPAGTTVPAHGTVVFWARNATYSGAAALTDEQFRAHYAGLGVTGSYTLVHLDGQNGLNNSGTSMYLTRAGAELARVTWTGTDVATDRTVTYGLPPAGSTQLSVHGVQQAPTPGDVAQSQVSAPTASPTPTVTASPTSTPTSTPTADPTPTVPEQGPPPATDPTLQAPILQVTEVAPDTTNVGGADGYEFIEVYNASDAAVSFADFTINYLYIDGSLKTTNAALWPAVPHDPVLEPGRTLVLWIKNGGNTALTAADFNRHFGSRLTAGVDLVEIFSGGMANGGLRGIQVMTNTGHDISRAYYLDDSQTVADRPIHYRWAGDAAQELIGTGTATPGYAAPDQVPAGLVATPADSTAPVIEDLSGGTDAPQTEGLALDFEVTDDQLVRTVRLTVETDIDEPTTRHLQAGAPDRYAYAIPEVDLFGKEWVEYTVTASDGTHTTTLGPVRVTLQESEPDPVRLNVADGQHVGGLTRLSATTSGDPAALAVTVDGTPVAAEPALETSPVFAFEATNTDAFFRNGVRMGEQVLTVFDQGFYERVETVATDIPVEQVVQGQPLTVGIYAGTKAWPRPDSNENNDDFSALNLRLALPDGRVLRPVACAAGGETAPETTRACPDPTTRIGFNDANLVYFTATFAIPDDAFTSRAHTWDTSTVADGPHTVRAVAGDQSATATVRVDNTAPEITPSIASRVYRGDFVVDAQASDSGSGVADITATIDGEPVTLPWSASSLTMEPGTHTAAFLAADEIGNSAAVTVEFTTADEQPSAEPVPPTDTRVTAGPVELRATVDSPEGDDLTVRFREGYAYDPTDAQVKAYSGTAHDALATDRAGRSLLTGEQLTRMAGTDGLTEEISSDTELPYQLFTVQVPADAGADARARLAWEGTANPGAKVLLHVRNTETGRWEEVDRHVSSGDDAESFTLGGLVPTAGHVEGGEMTVLVQHSEGFAGEVRSTRDSQAPAYHQGATPRNQYDFTIAWESDTQYYNEEFYDHQLAIHEFLLDQRDELNIQYLIHTGDIVDEYDKPQQWKNADEAYRMLDEAGLPYGVLAGNHDVGGHAEDYSAYGEFFGRDRYQANPWYGGQIENNRGHYDLVSAGGVDFLMLYLGWGPTDEQIAWMNEVIARHPERKVWVNLHEFMLTTGGLGPIPQRIMDEVVATNPNVFAVSSGHYHDAYTRTDDFDDDGDGTSDRTVYSMLFDYQGLPEGGQGYLRLMHFDNAGEQIVVRTYSPSLKDFDSDDASLNNPPGMQDFTIPYSEVGIEPAEKTLATDSFRADILTTRTIAERTGVPSGTTVSATWNAPEGERGWYVETTGPHGGVDHSAVQMLTVEPAPTSTPTPSPEQPTPGTPAPSGSKPAGTVTAVVPPVKLGGRKGSTVTVSLSANGQPVTGTALLAVKGRVFEFAVVDGVGSVKLGKVLRKLAGAKKRKAVKATLVFTGSAQVDPFTTGVRIKVKKRR